MTDPTLFDKMCLMFLCIALGMAQTTAVALSWRQVPFKKTVVQVVAWVAVDLPITYLLAIRFLGG